MSGSIQSTSRRSGRWSASDARALRQSSASRTSKPARFRPNAIISRIGRSSSTIKTCFAGMCQPDCGARVLESALCYRFMTAASRRRRARRPVSPAPAASLGASTASLAISAARGSRSSQRCGRRSAAELRIDPEARGPHPSATRASAGVTPAAGPTCSVAHADVHDPVRRRARSRPSTPPAFAHRCTPARGTAGRSRSKRPLRHRGQIRHRHHRQARAERQPRVTLAARRTPVKPPGPRPNAMASRSRSSRPPSASTASIIGRMCSAWPRAVSSSRVIRPRPSSSAAEHSSVAVSSARIFIRRPDTALHWRVLAQEAQWLRRLRASPSLPAARG